MAAFDRLDWARFDVQAAVANEGVAVVEAAHVEDCRAWLRSHGYASTSIDLGRGVAAGIDALGKALGWREQFGYELTASNFNGNALRDGFDFGLHPGGGHVLELLEADVAHREDPCWLSGLLSIAREYSRRQLALGARFFVVLVLDRDSTLIGATYESLSVPAPFWTPTLGNPFASGQPR